jgi:hypothetical protein
VAELGLVSDRRRQRTGRVEAGLGSARTRETRSETWPWAGATQMKTRSWERMPAIGSPWTCSGKIEEAGTTCREPWRWGFKDRRAARLHEDVHACTHSTNGGDGSEHEINRGERKKGLELTQNAGAWSEKKEGDRMLRNRW